MDLSSESIYFMVTKPVKMLYLVDIHVVHTVHFGYVEPTVNQWKYCVNHTLIFCVSAFFSRLYNY